MPSAVDVTGTANSAATVSINDQATVRKGDYFYKELAVNNSAGPVYQQITVVGARQNFGAGGEDAVTQQGGRVFLPQSVESFAYDFDGNLTSDGRWNYTWDAENRLVSMEAIPSVPVEAKQRLEFAYDATVRRIQKKVYIWNIFTSTYQLQSTTKFVYDGWNLAIELDGNNNLLRSYVRDVGDLLLINGGGNSYEVNSDGVGSVGLLVNANTGTASASYEYDPFGQTTKAVGVFSSQNPIRFSGKYADSETGLIYYGYRYYDPRKGTWISRDPIAESGGINLYEFVHNTPTNAIDALGLYTTEDVRRALIKKHGSKLKFVLDQIYSWQHTFEVTTVENGPNFVGGDRVAFVSCKANSMDEAADWGLDALREWASDGAKDGGYFNEITRKWASFGDGANDMPSRMGSTIDWLYLFAKNSSASATGNMYSVDGGNYDLFNIYAWVFTNNSSPWHGPRNIPGGGITSDKGLNQVYWDMNGGLNKDDQTHHFAFFFWFGARRGSSWAVLAPVLHETHDLDWRGRVLNAGDVNLGILGARWGARFKQHPGFVGNDVSTDLRNGTGYQ